MRRGRATGDRACGPVLFGEPRLGIGLRSAPAGLPLAFMRSGVGNAREQLLHGVDLAKLLQLVERFPVILQRNVEHLAILADADAGLRCFDAAAADALPGRKRFAHRGQSAAFGAWSASTRQPGSSNTRG